MIVSPAATTLLLLHSLAFFLSLVAAASSPAAVGSIQYLQHRRHHSASQIGSERDDLARQRVKRSQVDTVTIRALEASGGSRIKRTNRVGPSSVPTPPPNTCPTSSNPNAPTYQCARQDTSDGCNDPDYYRVGAQGVELLNGRKFQANGHVNFKYILHSEYQGVGSYRNKPSNWNVLSGGLHFDPNNNQPGGRFIGQSTFDWSAGANLPDCGYCIVWVQIDGFNVHFGENGNAPICECPSSNRGFFAKGAFGVVESA